MAKTPTVEESLATRDAANRQIAAHLLPLCMAAKDKAAGMDFAGLADLMTAMIPLMEVGADKTSLVNLARVVPQIPALFAKVNKAAEDLARPPAAKAEG